VQRSVRLPLFIASAAALALARAPIQSVSAQEDCSAADLGMMDINIKYAIKVKSSSA